MSGPPSAAPPVSPVEVSSARRVRAAVAAGRVAATTSRRLGRGSGWTIGGRVTQALAPDALSALSTGRRVVLVTGTNGKSTTTALTAAALGGAATNATGANMSAGLIAALAADQNPVAVLEVDELHLPAVARATHPDVVVLLNLSRDQQDRSHEVARIARAWREVLAAEGTQVVANAIDPNVAWAAPPDRTTWVRPRTQWRGDARVCPRSGDLLSWDADGWRCVCGLAQPAADVAVGEDGVQFGEGAYVPVALGVPGPVNVDNAAFALAVADLLEVPPSVAAARFPGIVDVGGRYRQIRVGGTDVRLLLAKNPAGWEAAFGTLGEDLGEGRALALGVNAQGVDSRDTSWLWDVDFTLLHGHRVGVFGEAAEDLTLRLSYEGVDAVQAETLPQVLSMLGSPSAATALANYSAFRQLLRMSS